MTIYEVTLKGLRQKKACIAGYNKVVCSLKGQPFTDEHRDKKTYIRFAYKKPISLLFILESNGFSDALWALNCINDADRDIRLFAVWCARQVQHLMRDPRSLNALDVVERFADGKATKEELDVAWDAARAASAEARAVAWDAVWAARAAESAASGESVAAWDAASAVAWDAAWDAESAASAAWDAARAAQEEMFKLMCQGQAPWQTQG